MARSDGVDATLRTLRDAGVYVRFEEFKGRAPIVRDGQVFEVDAHAFDNPFLRHAYQGETGGSTGAGTRVEIDLDHIAALVPLFVLIADAHGALDNPAAMWSGALPDSSGIMAILFASYLGVDLRRWFAPIADLHHKPALKYRLATMRRLRSRVSSAWPRRGPSRWRWIVRR